MITDVMAGLNWIESTELYSKHGFLMIIVMLAVIVSFLDKNNFIFSIFNWFFINKYKEDCQDPAIDEHLKKIIRYKYNKKKASQYQLVSASNELLAIYSELLLSETLCFSDIKEINFSVKKDIESSCYFLSNIPHCVSVLATLIFAVLLFFKATNSQEIIDIALFFMAVLLFLYSAAKLVIFFGLKWRIRKYEKPLPNKLKLSKKECPGVDKK